MQMIMDFVNAHSVALSAVVVALLDFAIALAPQLESNSIVQLILSVFKKKPQA